MSPIPSSIPAVFARGGTSNALIIQRSALPPEIAAWRPILAAAMGSPDFYGRQLNGMGSGLSSTSKVCVIAPSEREDADVDYTFVQVDIRTGELDFSGNCGNMSSAIGPVSLSEGVVEGEDVASQPGFATVRIFNTNTSKTIRSTFTTDKSGMRFEPRGDFAVHGVPGHGSRITLSFMNPAGSKTGSALPTGRATDLLRLEDGREVMTSLVDVTTPVVYVRAEDFGVDRSVTPSELEARSDTMCLLERVRKEGALAMGLDPAVSGVPKLALLLKSAKSTDIEARAISMQQPHRAIPVTVALNLGAAVRLQGSLPAHMLACSSTIGDVTIGHASGSIEVGCTVENGMIKSAVVHRTARVLMRGNVMLH